MHGSPMNWGDLWKYPFLASVWGDVATWFGAVGTTAAVFTAVGYYIYQHRAEKRKQAMLIAVKVNEWHRRMKDEPIGRDLMDFEIRNDSASDIREVSAE